MKKTLALLLSIAILITVLQAFGSISVFAEKTEKYTGYVYELSADWNNDYIYKISNVGYTENGIMKVVISNIGDGAFTASLSPREKSAWDYYLKDRTANGNVSFTLLPGETQLFEIPVSQLDPSSFFLMFIKNRQSSVTRFAMNINGISSSKSSAFTVTGSTLELTPIGKYSLALDSTYTYTRFKDNYCEFAASGDYAVVTNRTDRSSCISQDLIGAIRTYGSGKYVFSAQVRLRETPSATVKCNFGLDQKDSWPATNDTVLSTEWTRVNCIKTVDSTKEIAQIFLQTKYADGTVALVDVDIDSVCIIPLSNPSVNIVANAGFEDGIISWGKYHDCKCASSNSDLVSAYMYESTSNFSHWLKAGSNDGISNGVMTSYIKNLCESDMKVKLSPRYGAKWDYLFTADPVITIHPNDTAKIVIPITQDQAFFLMYVDSDDPTTKFACSHNIVSHDSATGTYTKSSALTAVKANITYTFDANGAESAVNTAPMGDYVIVTDRDHRSASASQDLINKIKEYGGGNYYVSAQVRLSKESATPIECNIGLDQSNPWPQTKPSVILSTEWTQVSGTLTLSSGSTAAQFYVQTLYTKNPSTGAAWTTENNDVRAAKVDIEIDSVCVVPLSDPDVNLIENHGFDADGNGAIASWKKYQSCNFRSNRAVIFTPGEGEKQADGSIVYADGQIPYTDENIVYSGRWLENNGGMKGSFECYAEIRFTGTKLTVIGGGKTYVSVDGGTEKQIALSGVNTVASGLTDTEHTARIISQAQTGFPVIKGFIVDENCKTLPIPKTPTIEFIGDSITEGYIVGNNSYLNSYAYLTGKKLGWRFNTIAFGGIAATVGKGSPDNIGIAERYLRQTEKGGFGENDYYAFANDDLDYTVINIGTNDGNPTSSTAVANFKSGYTQLLDNVFEHHPDCTVFVMIPFLGRCKTLIEDVVENYDQSKNIHIIYSNEWNKQFTYNTDPDGLHPDYESHVLASNNLYDIIMEYHNNRFYGANLVLEAALTVNFYAELEDAANSTVKVTRNGETTVLTGELDANTGKYRFEYTGINPQCMTDIIRAELFVGGELYEKKDISVQGYCNALCEDEKSDDALKALINATLIYGAAAQNYTGYNEDKLAAVFDINSFIAPEPIGVANAVITPKKDDNNEVLGAGLLLENVPKIYFRLKIQDGVEAYLNGVKASIVEVDGKKCVFTDGVISTAFDSEFTLTLKSGDTVLHSVKYSVNTYLKNKWNVQDNDKLLCLVRALNEYGYTSEAYQGK